jgi:deoxyribodipyrimidine photo-lyase
MKKYLKQENQLFNQLFWKEFYVYISKYIPHVLEGKSMKLKYDKIKWDNNNNVFKKWCEGKTGFPIVDAGMRELNKTGYMHNRSRLITSGFLVKLALIDWRKGEKYFAQKLTDYDPAQNNGGWQWSSGSGADSQPYFRIMSPISQSSKFDPDGSYIKKWIPELKDVEAKHLHDWEKFNNLYDLKEINYVKPCLDYKNARKRTMEIYKKYLN